MESEFSYRVTYRNPYDFRLIADKFKLMNDFRGGMTRTAYYGIVTFSTNRIRVYIVPEKLDLSKDFGTYSSSDVYELKWDLMNRYLDFKLTYCKPDR
jgi:CRISPR/Cas system CSM-associated protein Csm3 (group 7 of RAMP superfamily)